MRHGYLQFNPVPRTAKPARGAARRMRASGIILGMTLMMVLVLIAANGIAHLVHA